MHKIRIFLGIIVIIKFTACASSGEIRELDEQIVAKRAEMTRITEEIRHQIIGTQLNINKDLYSAVRYSAISQWLQEITTPAYIINGIGIESHGDIVYVPRIGKAWLEPPRDTRIQIILSNMNLSGDFTGAKWGGSLRSDLEMRIKFSILGVGGNMHCGAHISDTVIAGTLKLGTASKNTVPYQFSLVTPSSIPVVAECDLGRLGNYKQSFEIKDIARDLNKGDFSLGFVNEGSFQLPKETGGKRFVYTITANDPQLSSGPTLIEYGTDVRIEVKPD